MRVVVVSQIFPNRIEPLMAPFARQQLGELGKFCDLTVIDAIPYFPPARWIGTPKRTAKLSALPDHDIVAGIDTLYMRHAYLPAIGVPLAIPLYLASLLPYRDVIRSADVVLGAWGYPDACAAILFAKALGKPCVVEVYGSDVNVTARKRLIRPLIRNIYPHATAGVAVSQPLANELIDLGVPSDRVFVVPNGVDTSLFRPQNRAEARRELGLHEGRKIILFVGRLEPQKGLGELMPAFEEVRRTVPDALLALVGTGVWSDKVAEWRSKFPDSVVAPGARPLAEVARWLAACDVFTLPSWREGTPNAVLEATACARPVVASSVGGIPDVLTDGVTGLLVPPRESVQLAKALASALNTSWNEKTIHQSSTCSWQESARRLYEVLEKAVATHR